MALDLTVVIAARDAASTLGDTLESLRGQSETDWTAIVVDDGSRDATAAVAHAFASRDPRIAVIEAQHQGVAAARNLGVAHSSSAWLLFLDADDLITPDCFERFAAAIALDPEAEWIVAGWARLVDDEPVLAKLPDIELLSHGIAGHCPVCIHACLVRRALVHELGGFDPALATCEDWDLWLRCSRSDVRIALVPAVVALYRMRAGQASRRPQQVFADGLRVIARARAPDPRIARVRPQPGHNAAPAELAARRVAFSAWAVGLALGRAEDVDEIVAALGDERATDVDVGQVAHSLYEAPLLARGVGPAAWSRLWPELEPALRSALEALERRSGAPRLAARVMRRHEGLVAGAIPDRPLTVGSTHAVSIDADHPLTDVPLPADVVAVRCDVRAGGAELGALHLPAVESTLSAWVLEDAIAAELGWKLLERFFAATLPAGLDPERWSEHGWTVFLHELWGRSQAWTGRPRSRQRRWWGGMLRAAARVRCTAARVRSTVATRGARPWVTAEVSLPLPALPFGRRPIDVAVTVAGELVGVLAVRPTWRGATSQLRSAISTTLGAELAVAAAREGLVGRTLDDPTPLRSRLAGRARAAAAGAGADVIGGDRFDFGPGSATVMRAACELGAVVLGRRRGTTARSSVSRRATLPRQSGDVLTACAAAADEPLLVGEASQPGPVVYAPALAWRESPPRGGADVPARRGGTSGTVARVAAPARRNDATDRLPILMYHRIAEHRSEPSDRYCVTPRAFAKQLSFLADQGFVSASLEDWFAVLQGRVALPGRRVAITFDDGYADFLSEAWPLLQRHGFGATMFVVADRVGSDSAWDRIVAGERVDRREPVPLLTWDELIALHEQGLELGGHTCTHQHLTALTPAEVVAEAAGARAALAARVGCVPRAFAYPYGDVDAVTRHLVGACGFELGLTCRPGPSGVWEDPLDLSRIEVGGDDDVAVFASKLEGRREWRQPRAGDLRRASATATAPSAAPRDRRPGR